MWENLTPTLEGSSVRLEPLAPEHEEALFAALDDPTVWTFLPIAQPDRAGFTKFFEFLANEVAAGRQGVFVTLRRADGAVLGTSSYLALRPDHHSVEIGYTLVGREAWGTGANSEAKFLMLQHAFEDLGLMRVEFKTDANNKRSCAALAALPAQFEGIFRRHMITNYGVRDSAYYSVTDEDWPAVKAKLRDRIAAQNA
jgi:RimJ/RimL family protein N-acetyltransferase